MDFRVEAPVPGPTMTAPPAAWGQTWPVTLSHPSQPYTTYVAVASLENQSGFSLGGANFVSLDPDALFALTVPVPAPFFVGFGIGALDANGDAFLAVIIPPDPGLLVQKIHVQAVLLGGPNGTILSTCLDGVLQ